MKPTFSPEELERIKRATVVNILKKIESGGVPTARESAILEAAAVPATAPEAAASAEPPAAAGFTLAADAPQRINDIAAGYGVDRKTVRRWRQRGEACGDPAPLHDPAAMLLWYPKVFKQRPPACIEKAAAAAKSAPAPQPSGAGITPLPTLPAFPDIHVSLDDFSFEAGVNVTRINFQVQAAQLNAALRSGDPAQVRTAQIAFNEAWKAYREAERDKAKILEAEGLTLPKERVRQELIDLHGNISKRFRTDLIDAFLEVPTAVADRETWTAFVHALVDRICSRLQETQFCDPAPHSRAS